MKKTVLTLFSTFVLLNFTYAQVSAYSFTQSTGTYTAFTGGTLVAYGTNDNSVFGALNIGFPFIYNGTSYTQFGLDVNGWISLGATVPTYSYMPISGGTVNNIISPLGADLQLGYTSSGTSTLGNNTITNVGNIAGFAIGDTLSSATGFAANPIITAISSNAITVTTNATSATTTGTYTVKGTIRYQTTGTIPNRVCVIQWNRARRYGTSLTGTYAGQNNYFNFQIRLTETANTIDFIYGQFQTNATSSVYQVGLRGSAATDFFNRKTTSSWAGTAPGTVNTDTCSLRTTVLPVSGQTFTFTPPPPCSGIPTAGNATGPTGACSGVPFNLVLANYSPNVSGLTFQWQSSTTSGGTYVNISGATTSTYAATQTVAMFYKCVVTCTGSGLSATTTSPVSVPMNSPTNCYCIPTSSCSSNDAILNVTIATLNNTSTCSTGGYTAYTTPTATLNQAASYPIAVTVDAGGTEYVGAWIDYNQNGVFEASEFTSIGSGNGVVINSSITISPTATLGVTKMRIRVQYSNAFTGADACTAAYLGYGETEDYLITIGAGTACTGNPNPGTASGPTSACSGVSFSLALTGYTSNVAGIAFQWQSSSTLSGTYSNIAGATSSTYSTSLSSTTYYKCNITCSGGTPVPSNIVTVTLNTIMNCYCVAAHVGVCSTSDNIDSVRIVSTSLANLHTGCTGTNGNAYTIYAPSGSTTATLAKGSTYSFKVTTTTSNIVSVWIDYNQNGVYDSVEWKQVCTTSVANTANTVSITIPTSALTGLTGMRIRSRSAGSPNGPANACTSFASGETEDYKVTIAVSTGITENNIGDISVYPNPTAGLFNITASNANFSELTINVFDIQGKEVFSAIDRNSSLNYNKQINLEGIAKGIYYIKLNTGNGVKIQKLIIQ